MTLWGSSWTLSKLSHRFRLNYNMLRRWHAAGELTEARLDAWLEAKERRRAARRR